ncbi:cation-translocating P-type ATPase [Candidatus Daviesbacteria bacterium]|nr:cation-translocating P-type ATPase [Candidatus Daviesbacteria bacterium]
MNKGLTSDQAKVLLAQHGLNKLPQKNKVSTLNLLVKQVNNALFYLLLAATLLSFLIGDKLDAFLISAILVLNASLGFWQEYKASKELEALSKLEVSKSRVIRDGQEQLISSSEIVPGDLIVLEPGDKIPADGIVAESISLSINEASLTGESMSVVKTTDQEDNLIFLGTVVVSGRGKFVVTSTGANTKFGKIALNLAAVEDETTPLETALSGLSKTVGLLALGVAAAMFLIRVAQGFDLFEMLFTSIALMVAVVPEGLPTVVIIVLALGVRKMYQKKALVRKMVAVESLGAATVICTDKTGTLTENKMKVKEVKVFEDDLPELRRCAVLCNSASLVLKEDHGGYDILGDTTEGALLIWAKDDHGLNIEELRQSGKLLKEQPFNLKTRMMRIVWEEDNRQITYVKGAPETILIQTTLPDGEIGRITKEYEQMATKGLRVLAFAKAIGDKKEGLEYLGLIGIADSPRPEAKEAIQKAKDAGIKVVMITGDNELTAKAIAEEVGLMEPGDEVLTGKQLDELNEESLLEKIGLIRIFARIEPEQKLRIVKAYQSKGEIVAVTGDGVNDSLALKQAHVGISMGISGTDVAKEAADIVLLDDNFATLISAVEQGRRVYSNILKVVKFLLTGNLSEVLLIILAVLIGLPTPLLPAQILWINFATDGLPALALGTDKPSPNIMRLPPRKGSILLGKDMLQYILLAGIIIAGITLGVFYYSLRLYGLEFARALTFSMVVFLQMTLPFIIRRHHTLLSNKFLVFSVLFVLVMQVLIMTLEPLRILFKI